MIKNKQKVLALLDSALNTVADSTIKSNQPIYISPSATLLGDIVVERTSANYCIRKSKIKHRLYKDIVLYESAVLIAQAHIARNPIVIREILEIDDMYARHKTNMQHYAACYAVSKKCNDTARMLVLEDKFTMSEEYARQYRTRLVKFKIL